MPHLLGGNGGSMCTRLWRAGAAPMLLAALLLTSCATPAHRGPSESPPRRKESAAAQRVGFPATEPGWWTEDVWMPRYGDDGRAIYYIASLRSESEDGAAERVAAAASVEATASFIDPSAPGVPRDIPETLADADRSRSLVSSGGRFTVRLADDGTGMFRTTLAAGAGGSEPAVRTAGTVDAAGWVDDRHLAVLRHAGGIVELDVATGRSRTILAAGSDGPAVYRMAVYPGLVLFNVWDADDDGREPIPDDVPQPARLFSYDAATRTVTERGPVAMFDSWDYSPSRGTLLYVPYDRPVIIETSLEGMD